MSVFDAAGCRIDTNMTVSETPETLLSRSQTHTHIRAAIMALPEVYRIVLCLRDIEGLTTEETAIALEISQENVKIRLHRARASLKALLEPFVRGQNL
ncbi:MAG: sigma-70 family RNA polymerase sigma factor [Pseudomonadota bacterium]